MASGLTGAGLLGAMLEKVDPNLYRLFENSKMFYFQLQKKSRTEEVSMRPYRIPIQFTPTGLFSGYDPDGGDMGVGNGPVIDHAELTPIYHRQAARFTQKALYTTDTSQKAVVKANTLVIDDALKTMQMAIDQTAQGPGNGQLGIISSVSTSTATMQVPNGANGVYDGEQVNVISADLTTLRNPAGPLTVAVHDEVQANTVTFTTDISGLGIVSGDLIVDPFITPQNPFGLFGVKYHQNNAVTGTWQNLDRSAYPFNLRTSRVNAGGGALQHLYVMQVIAKMKKSIGIEQFQKGKYKAYCNTDQEIAYKQLGINVQIINKIGPGGQNASGPLDVLYSNSIQFEGIGLLGDDVSIRADQTRIDFFDMSRWLRVVSKEISFYKNLDGQMVFQQYGDSGGVAAAWLFYYDVGHQIGNTCPLAGGFIDSLAAPNLY
jgi:hypothetical protein